jgi:acyl dehydratase
VSARYLEDLRVGEKTLTGSVTVTQAEMLDFSRQFDPQAIHTDPNVEGGIIASGWHTGALVMRLVADAKPLGSLPILGMGVDNMAWPLPVRPGDTIQVETEVLAIRPSNSKPTHGIVKLRSAARNQKGEVVFVVTPNVWVPRRPNA